MKSIRQKAGITGIFLLNVITAQAQEQIWGISAVTRRASVPWETAGHSGPVSDFIPAIYVDSKYFFLDGLAGGVYLYQSDQTPWKLSTLARYRFLEHPDAGKNDIENNATDVGIQLRYQPHSGWKAEVELMRDKDNHSHANLRLTARNDWGDWRTEPSLTIRYKDDGFNSTYYALSASTGEQIHAGADVKLGLNVRYHAVSSLYLLGGVSLTRLDDQAYHSRAVRHRYQNEYYLGFGFFKDSHRPYKPTLKNRPYIRVAHGWATPSDVEEIFILQNKPDRHNNQLSSVFYGYPLTDELFGYPVDVYLTPGIAHHWSSSVQHEGTEYVIAVKGYLDFEWPFSWRFGVAEGLSYVDSISYIEATEIYQDGGEPSHLLNYLDFSFDVNAGEVFQHEEWKHIRIGYSMHHRSGLFKASSQFKRLRGGSNYNMIYLQYEF